MKKLVFILTLLMGIAFPSNSYSSVISVPADYPSIQQAIDNAINGDTVLVDAGVYYENIDFVGKDIVVTSHYILNQDSSYISSTIIFGNDTTSVVSFSNNESSNAILMGFTITNGGGSSRYYPNFFTNQLIYGGGVIIENSSPTLMHLKITNNNPNLLCCVGGGIFALNSSSLIENVEISNNTLVSPLFESPDAGAAIAIFDSQSTRLINLKILNNSGTDAIDLFQSDVFINNCLIANNYGGSTIFCNTGSSNTVEITGCTISNNFADAWGTPGHGYIEVVADYNVVMTNTIGWFNDPPNIKLWSSNSSIDVAYCNIEDSVSSIIGSTNYTWNNSIGSDPQFVDTAIMNYELLNGSPCINTGNPDTSNLQIPTFDLSGNNRVYNGVIDIGAYEAVSFASIVENLQLKPYELRVFPNPTKEIVTISLHENIDRNSMIEIFSISGKLIYAKAVDNHQSEQKINTSRFDPGLYFSTT